MHGINNIRFANITELSKLYKLNTGDTRKRLERAGLKPAYTLTTGSRTYEWWKRADSMAALDAWLVERKKAQDAATAAESAQQALPGVDIDKVHDQSASSAANDTPIIEELRPTTVSTMDPITVTVILAQYKVLQGQLASVQKDIAAILDALTTPTDIK